MLEGIHETLIDLRKRIEHFGRVSLTSLKRNCESGNWKKNLCGKVSGMIRTRRGGFSRKKAA